LRDRITYVGLDVHKDGIVVAVAEDGLRGEVRDYGRIANTPAALRRLVGKLGHHGVTLRFCYEAGPCGYGIQRQLAAAGHDCVVVAPSLIPKRPGDRIKTDRRDACSLAKLHRAGELTAGSTLGTRTLFRHARDSGHPERPAQRPQPWTPAFAGVTRKRIWEPSVWFAPLARSMSNGCRITAFEPSHPVATERTNYFRDQSIL
jgi:hypothetical protein